MVRFSGQFALELLQSGTLCTLHHNVLRHSLTSGTTQGLIQYPSG